MEEHSKYLYTPCFKLIKMVNHYVYCSYEKDGRHYIGSRTCDCLIEKDDEYMRVIKNLGDVNGPLNILEYGAYHKAK